MICIGPSLLSGIGQVVKKYAEVLQTKYYVLGSDPIPKDQDVFMFALPIPCWLESIPFIKQVSRKVICMTICETETVHEDYGKLFDFFDEILYQVNFVKKCLKNNFQKLSFI